MPSAFFSFWPKSAHKSDSRMAAHGLSWFGIRGRLPRPSLRSGHLLGAVSGDSPRGEKKKTWQERQEARKARAPQPQNGKHERRACEAVRCTCYALRGDVHYCKDGVSLLSETSWLGTGASGATSDCTREASGRSRFSIWNRTPSISSAQTQAQIRPTRCRPTNTKKDTRTLSTLAASFSNRRLESAAARSACSWIRLSVAPCSAMSRLTSISVLTYF